MSDETCFVPVNNQDKSYCNYLLQIICKELVLIGSFESLLDASCRPLYNNNNNNNNNNNSNWVS